MGILVHRRRARPETTVLIPAGAGARGGRRRHEFHVVFLALVVICGLCAGTTAVVLAVALDRGGIRTPFPFIGFLIFRNLRRYRELTLRETGKVGPLFYAYVVPINLAMVFALVAFAAFLLSGKASASA